MRPLQIAFVCQTPSLLPSLAEVGNVALPRNVASGPDMPQTASGKIMPRVLSGTSTFTSPGDITSLANPEIVETILHHVQAAKVERGETPRQLSKEELEEIKAFGQAE